MKVRLLVLSLFIFVQTHGGWQSVGNVDSFSSSLPSEVTLRAGSSIVKITVLAPDLIRVRLAPDESMDEDFSWAITKRVWDPPDVALTDSPGRLVVATSEISLWIQKRPLRLSFADKNGNIINEDEPSKGMAWSATGIRVWKKMPEGEHYYGFGEKSGRLNRKWNHMSMWNSDIPAYRADTDPLYQTVPFFYGINNGRAYGIFFDNTYWSSFDMGKESQHQYSFGAEEGELNYYFFYGPAPKKVLSRFTELVGRMPLPPRWSLGYQQCRWSYTPETRVREIASGFRDRKIPCDVLYLDIDYMDGYRIFTWNNANFPDPRKMIADLRADGFRLAVIVDPGIKADTAYHAYRSGLAGDHFLRYPDGRTFIGKVWPGECAFPDFTNPNARTWWGNNFADLIATGVRGWWNDMNEPSVFDVPTKTVDLSVVHRTDYGKSPHARNHNIYGMQMTRATYDGVRRLLPTERPFVLTRASYAGGHRYSSAWTGDNVSSWEHLRMVLPMCLNMSISGQPFVGSDIGGFIGAPSGELFARWLQLGVFSPLMRAHSVINERNKEPWEYGDEFTTINRETINLRYQLLPYIYSTMREASETGIPAMRPLVFEYPGDLDLVWNETEFMFGNDMLIAPVLDDSARIRRLRLPQGIWYDYWSGAEYVGEKDISVEAPLNRIPIFVKEGAIIPSQQVVQHVDEAPIDPLTFTIFPVKLTSSTSYYEDDGLSFEYQNGVSLLRTISQWNSSTATTITLSRTVGDYVPKRRRLALKIVRVDAKPKNVEFQNSSLPFKDTAALNDSTRGWSYDQKTRIVWILVEDRSAELTFRIEK